VFIYHLSRVILLYKYFMFANLPNHEVRSVPFFLHLLPLEWEGGFLFL
jgi:hypothetical protein